MQADSLCYQTEKQLKEFGEKVPAETKTKVEEKVAALRKAVDDEDLEGMKAGIEALNQVTTPSLPPLVTQYPDCTPPVTQGSMDR